MTVPAAPVAGWWRSRTLRARLVAGVLLLLVVTCAVVGVATTVALRGFLVDRLDQQLADAGTRLAVSIEHPPDGDDAPGPSGLGDADLRGQVVGTFGARLVDGRVTDAAVLGEAADAVKVTPTTLSARDQQRLARLPLTGRPATVQLSGLGDYRVIARAGADGDVLVTGLPLSDVDATVHRLEAVDLVVFAGALVLVGVTGAGWVRLSLRPLRRVAATAMAVTRLPLGSGEVSLPARVEEADPATEVGQVGAAFNHMLEHVEKAFGQRQASEAQLRQFVADASHELRTPLAAIRGYAELARRDPSQLPPEVRQALARVESASERMGGLVDDLLLLARLDSGRPLARQPVDLSRLAIEAADDARVAGPDHHWVLRLPDAPVVVTGDEQRLHQVVANLLGNARVHTPPGTTVELTLASPDADGSVLLTVADDGPGIPADLADRVFERFVRADPSRSRAAGSTGLGLSIVAAVVAAHGGTVSVVSRPGRTVFEVRLPVGESDRRPADLVRSEL